MRDLADLFPGDSEMARRMRTFDWSATELGSPEQWPHTLRMSVRIVLTSHPPMFVWWGERLINLYNDAYASCLRDKHPAALGQPASAVWPEIWDDVGPRAESARRGAEGRDEALRLIMHRKGYPEETCFTVSCSPIPDDEGRCGGILCSVTEETERLAGERQSNLELVIRGISAAVGNASASAAAYRRAGGRASADLREYLRQLLGSALRREVEDRTRAEAHARASEEKYRTLFNSIDEGFCIIEPLFDETGTPSDYRFLEVNPSFEKQTGIVGAEGRTMREIAPQHEEHWYRIYGRVAETGESFHFERPAAQLHRWFDVYAFRAGGPDVRRVAVLFNDITARKQTEEALRVSEARQAFLVRLGDALRALTDPRAIMAVTTEMLGRHLHVSAAGYVEVGDDEETVSARGEYTDGRMPRTPGWHRLSEYGDAFRVVLRTGQELYVEDHHSDRRGQGGTAAAAITMRAAAAVPLVKHGRFVACLYAMHTEPRAWPAHERTLLHDVAERTWSAVERARAEEALRRARDELERRVQERTSELAATNATLEAEVRERRAAEDQIKRLFARLVTIQEDERRRIARDIHDHLGQQITALRMSLDVLRSATVNDAALAEQTSRAQRLAEELDERVDVLTWELRPAALDDLGLPAALASLVSSWSRRFGIATEFDMPGTADLRLRPDVEANLYLLAQEALHNVFKHASASRVSVFLGRRDHQVVLVIEDNGRGFSPGGVRRQPAAGGLGLVSMQERAMMIGGAFEIESAPGRGTTIFVRVPADNSEPAAHASRPDGGRPDEP